MPRFDNTINYIEQQISARLGRTIPRLVPFVTTLESFKRNDTGLLFTFTVSSSSKLDAIPEDKVTVTFTIQFSEKYPLPKSTRFPKWFKETVYDIAEQLALIFERETI